MIAKVVDKLVKVVPEGPSEEAALKLIVHLYQLLTAGTRSCIAPKGVKQVRESLVVGDFEGEPIARPAHSPRHDAHT
jgi:hypothetical protein